MDDEKHLVTRASSGDREAFMQLYEAYFHPVFKFVYYKVGNQELAEDITQETFLKAMKSILNFKGESKFRSWITQIAKFTVMDHFREKYQYTQVELADYLASDEPNLWEDEQESEIEEEQTHKENMLQNILEKVPKNYRTILEYRFLKNFNIQETAKEMNISVSNAKVLQFRALAKLKKMAKDGEIVWPDSI